MLIEFLIIFGVILFMIIRGQFKYLQNIKRINESYIQTVKILQGRNDPYRPSSYIFNRADIYGGSVPTTENELQTEYEKPKNDFIYLGDEKPKRMEVIPDDNEYPEGWNN